MFESLRIHPDCRCDAVTGIAAMAQRPRADVLTLRYRITGEIGGLMLPEPKPTARTDELWRHTCFEAFVRAGSNAGYFELNLAPSHQWAVYHFDGYRSGMLPVVNIAAPVIKARQYEGRFELDATIDLPQITSTEAKWRLGLSAVIEETDGRLSYWALAHPPGKPDFHHKDCFMLELAAPSSP